MWTAEAPYLIHIPSDDSSIQLLCHGAEKVIFDQTDVETILPIKGIEPFAPHPALVQQEGQLSMQEQGSRVQL